MSHFFFLSFFWEDYFWPSLKRPLTPETGLGLTVPTSNLTPNLQDQIKKSISWMMVIFADETLIILKKKFERKKNHINSMIIIEFSRIENLQMYSSKD